MNHFSAVLHIPNHDLRQFRRVSWSIVSKAVQLILLPRRRYKIHGWIFLKKKLKMGLDLDQVSFPSCIAIDISDRTHWRWTELICSCFCINLEQHICAHITASIRCYLHSLRYIFFPLTNIECPSNWYE